MSDTNYINRAAVKKLAIGYSKSNRAGTFTRVGGSFFDRINMHVTEVLAAELVKDETPLFIKRSEVKKLAKRMVEEHGTNKKVSGALLQKVNDRIREIVVGEVQRHPSMGKTLQ